MHARQALHHWTESLVLLVCFLGGFLFFIFQFETWSYKVAQLP